MHGFFRRLSTMGQCVENVFNYIPPDFCGIPDKETRKNTEIAIQSFVFNVSGALDNLAWVWVEEAAIQKPNGKPLGRWEVGLNDKCKIVRSSFSPAFQERLGEFDKWYEVHLEFRHALAHRIPLYIPPFCIDPKNMDEFNSLESQKHQAFKRVDVEAYERAEAEQMELAHFQPSISHSVIENSRSIAFHAQLIADFNTVDDIRMRMFGEIKNLHAA